MIALDHVIVAVRDLPAAVAVYQTILGVPPAVQNLNPPAGAANALFLFERGPYLELTAPVAGAAETPWLHALNAHLAERGEGLFGLAVSPDDLDATIAHLRGLGFDVPDPANGAGVSPDGRPREWRSTRPSLAVWDGVFSLLIEHRGWDWRSELRRAPLSERTDTAARSIHHIVFDMPDAPAASLAWRERFGLVASQTIDSERMAACVIVHAAGEATIEAVSATRSDGPVAEHIARRGLGLSSLAFQTDDLDAAFKALKAAGIAVTEPAPGVLPNSRVARVEPAAACGVPVQFLQFQ